MLPTGGKQFWTNVPDTRGSQEAPAGECVDFVVFQGTEILVTLDVQLDEL